MFTHTDAVDDRNAVCVCIGDALPDVVTVGIAVADNHSVDDAHPDAVAHALPQLDADADVHSYAVADPHANPVHAGVCGHAGADGVAPG